MDPVKIWVAAIVVAGCYAPKPQPGQPCGDGEPCPPGLVCSPATSTCETSLVDVDASIFDSPVDVSMRDACVPTAEICGDGIDQDCDGVDPPCPANDLPGGAIDVTAGGTFTADLKYAGDDASKPSVGGGPNCGSAGGRDVFYKVHLTTAQVYYFDTFGSDFDTVIRTYSGSCVAGPAPNGTSCSNDSCGTTQTQTAHSLPVGDTCIVIDQNSSAETNGSVHLHVEVGHRNGSKIATGMHTLTGNTATSTDQSTGTCSAMGNDDGYYFTLCPNDSMTLTASTCNAATTWDTALYADGPAGQLVCDDDDDNCAFDTDTSTITTPVAGAHLFWVVVDTGTDAASGAYELDTTIQ